MKVTHNFSKLTSSKQINLDNELSFLLSEKNGAYFSLGVKQNISYYQGFVFPIPNIDGWEMFKFIESIYIDNNNINEIKNNICCVERIGDYKESFQMPFKNTLLYEIKNKKNADIIIELDARKLYDFDSQGRIYSIEKVKNQKDIREVKKKIIKIRKLYQIKISCLHLTHFFPSDLAFLAHSKQYFVLQEGHL